MTKYTEKDMNALLDKLNQIIQHRSAAMALIRDLIVEIPEGEKKWWLRNRIQELVEKITPTIKEA
jgi:hypothetical protein